MKSPMQMSKLAMILAMFKHQQKAMISVGGKTNSFPYHSHKSKTFKKNKRRGY